MKAIRALPALLLLASCSNPGERVQSRIMDEVERTVQLPADAVRPEEYSRYFAQQPGGKVDVLYVVHGSLSERRNYCREHPVGVFPCARDGELELVGPGQRRWLDDSRDLPSMSGGGCGNIQFTYDPATKSSTAPECNGDY
jgi:hypothetical protein